MDHSRNRRDLNVEFSSNWKGQCPEFFHNDACRNGNVCKHGICVQEFTDDSFIPWASCHCEPSWLGESCDFCCDLPCVEGKCVQDTQDDIPYCLCDVDVGLGGIFCNETRNSTEPEGIYVHSTSTTTEWELPVVACTVFVVVLVVSVVLALYRLYRLRHPWLLKYLIKFHARNIDDTDKKYDAFLSYRTSDDEDRDFVRYTLLPHLEDQGYVICIDERDLLPGKSIAQNLGEAIHDSKRTILVISPAFIEGKWPEYEVQCALMEWLGKSQRVIPIIYKPIDEVKHKVSRSLNHLLKSITYLEWPEDANKEAEFWRRLILALPKKNEKEDISCKDKEKSLFSQQDLKVDLDIDKESSQEEYMKQAGMVNLALELEEALTNPHSSSAKLTDEYIV